MKTPKLAIGYIFDGDAVGYDHCGSPCYRGTDRMMPPCDIIETGEVARKMIRAHDRDRFPKDARQGELF